MRARTWVIAGCYRQPEDYDIPELPDWKVCRLECGSLAFADEGGEPFIAAENPTKVRR
jgi:hypothetical protein